MDAGARLFAERGYAASSMRQLAERAGVSLSASYYHFPGKYDVLLAIMADAMDRLEDAAREVMTSGIDPLPRLGTLMRAHVHAHLADPAAARVADGELRALDPKARRRMVARRDRYEGYVRTTLAQGVESGVFAGNLDIPITATAILTMGSSVVEWWRPSGRLSIDETARTLGDLVTAMAVHGGAPLNPSPDTRKTRARSSGPGGRGRASA